MAKFRVIKRRSARGPDYWGVQRVAGYTDGRPSWRLATRQPFYSKVAALAYIEQQTAAPR